MFSILDSVSKITINKILVEILKETFINKTFKIDGVCTSLDLNSNPY